MIKDTKDIMQTLVELPIIKDNDKYNHQVHRCMVEIATLQIIIDTLE